jgi:hypothetical protein
MKRSPFFFLAALCASTLANAATIPGNGATGFGGPVGTGSVTITDSPSGMAITLNRGTNTFNDDLVLYLDTQPGGFVDNAGFGDNSDGGRTAISGTNNGNPSKSLVSLPFAADYAFSMENGFIGAFSLANGGNNSFTFLFGQAQSGNNSDPSYTINISPAQMLQMGLTAGSGQTFEFVGSYISTSAYRSNETIGTSITVPADGAGNAGFSNPQTFTQSLSYTLVPEPTSFGLFLLGSIGFALRRRRR